DLSGDDRAVDRRMDRRRASHRALLLQRGNLFVGKADDAPPRARGFGRHFSRAHVVLGADQLALRLLIFLESRGLAFVQILEPLLDDAREVELRARLVHRRERRYEIVLRLYHFRAVDFEQRITAADIVADPGDQPRHTAGERGQDGGAGVLVVGDLADGKLLDAKGVELHLHDAELMHLVVGDPNGVALFSCVLRRYRG